MFFLPERSFIGSNKNTHINNSLAYVKINTFFVRYNSHNWILLLSVGEIFGYDKHFYSNTEIKMTFHLVAIRILCWQTKLILFCIRIYIFKDWEWIIFTSFVHYSIVWFVNLNVLCVVLSQMVSFVWSIYSICFIWILSCLHMYIVCLISELNKEPDQGVLTFMMMIPNGEVTSFAYTAFSNLFSFSTNIANITGCNSLNVKIVIQ